MPSVRLVWQLPVAILSYLFFKATRFCLRRLVKLHYRFHARRAQQWQVFSEEFLSRPLVLPVIMVEGPRWNTHALIAQTGPFRVGREIRIHLPLANRPAKSWTIVVYRFPGQRTVAAVGSPDVSSDEPWLTIPLTPGRYILVLRYYQWSDDVRLPEVWVDGSQAVDAAPIPPDANEFYCRLAARRSLFYRLLHDYVYVMLRYKDRLPRRWVEKEFLPVGNPETQFLYGALPRGKRLRIEVPPWVHANCDVYLTLYDRASFPVVWNEVAELEYETPRVVQDSMFLLRILSRTATDAVSVEQRVDAIRCTTSSGLND
jgi:hypothetical protein